MVDTPQNKTPETEAPEGERIAKRLARAGVASRRDCEVMIREGRVAVNGKKLETPAFLVTDHDKITVDGQPIGPIERTRLWLLHKRPGTVTTNKDPEGRDTVFDRLPPELPRVLTVGRLDINTEGLLLLTNDGGLARELEMPTTGWTRRYRVRVHGTPDEAALEALKDGIAVEGVLYGAIEANIDRVQGSNAWLNVALKEGKNREIKNVMGALGLEVTRLIRVSFGPFQLDDLEVGAVREINGRVLREQLGDGLIARAGCNFDAPIVNNFSNKPVAEKREDTERPKKQARPQMGRKEVQAARKSSGLAKLDTKKAEPEPPRSRSSYVWMAPGGRPQGPKKQAENADRAADYKRAKPFRTKGGRKSDEPASDRPRDKYDADAGKPKSWGDRGKPAGGDRGKSFGGPDRSKPAGGDRGKPFGGPDRSKPAGGDRGKPFGGPDRGKPAGGDRGKSFGGPDRGKPNNRPSNGPSRPRPSGPSKPRGRS